LKHDSQIRKFKDRLTDLVTLHEHEPDHAVPAKGSTPTPGAQHSLRPTDGGSPLALATSAARFPRPPPPGPRIPSASSMRQGEGEELAGEDKLERGREEKRSWSRETRGCSAENISMSRSHELGR
jgi:hypothetical protein